MAFLGESDSLQLESTLAQLCSAASCASGAWPDALLQAFTLRLLNTHFRSAMHMLLRLL